MAADPNSSPERERAADRRQAEHAADDQHGDPVLTSLRALRRIRTKRP